MQMGKSIGTLLTLELFRIEPLEHQPRFEDDNPRQGNGECDQPELKGKGAGVEVGVEHREVHNQPRDDKCAEDGDQIPHVGAEVHQARRQ